MKNKIDKEYFMAFNTLVFYCFPICFSRKLSCSRKVEMGFSVAFQLLFLLLCKCEVLDIYFVDDTEFLYGHSVYGQAISDGKESNINKRI